MLRITVSGSGGACIVSAKVSVQFVPSARPSLVSEGICGRLRRMRIACPFSSGSRLTSAMMAPPLARIGSTSIGWSDRTPATRCRRGETAPRASPWQRRTSRAGRRCPAWRRPRRRCAPPPRWLRRRAVRDCTGAVACGRRLGAPRPPSPALPARGLRGFHRRRVWAKPSSAAALRSRSPARLGGGGRGASAPAESFGAVSGLISILACSAMVSEVTGGISAGLRAAARAWRRLSREARAAGCGLAGTSGVAAACAPAAPSFPSAGRRRR